MKKPLEVIDLKQNGAFSECATLSIREREVMSLVAKGFSNKAIARELDLAVGTIKLHLHKIYQKVGVHSRFALAAHVMKEANGQSK